MTNNNETGALGKYLASERLWLSDVQRERGGRIYLETLGEKMVTALAVAFHGGDVETSNRGRAFFDMVFGMACEYASVLGDEAVMLRSFLLGIGDSMVDFGIQIGEMPKEADFEDGRVAARVAGGMLARHLRVALVWMDTRWAVKNLQEQMAAIEAVEEVHLQKFMGGIKGELIQRGIIQNEKRETV